MDEIKVTILIDGSVKVQTDEISPANHLQADNLMKFLAEKLGAPVAETKAKHAHEHAHDKAKASH